MQQGRVRVDDVIDTYVVARHSLRETICSNSIWANRGTDSRTDGSTNSRTVPESAAAVTRSVAMVDLANIADVIEYAQKHAPLLVGLLRALGSGRKSVMCPQNAGKVTECERRNLLSLKWRSRNAF